LPGVPAATFTATTGTATSTQITTTATSTATSTQNSTLTPDPWFSPTPTAPRPRPGGPSNLAPYIFLGFLIATLGLGAVFLTWVFVFRRRLLNRD
jgi:hypothetical protein